MFSAFGLLSLSSTLFLPLQIAKAQVPANAGWLSPAASSGDFAEQYTNLDTINLSWLAMNKSHSDLWVTAYDPSANGFAKLVKADINLKVDGSRSWKININGNVIDADDRFVLRFVENGTIYSPAMIDQIPSPGFTVVRREGDNSSSSLSSVPFTSSSIEPSVSSYIESPSSLTNPSTPSSTDPSTTATAHGASYFTSATTVTATAASSNSNNSLSDGTIAGVAIGAAAALALFIGVGFFIGTRQKRHGMGRLDDEKSSPPDTNIDVHEQPFSRGKSVRTFPDTFEAPTYYRDPRELTGSSKQPVELDASHPEPENYHGHQEEANTPTVSHTSFSGTFSPISPPGRRDSTTQ